MKGIVILLIKSAYMHIFREHEIQKKVLFIEYMINIFIVYFIIN